MTELVVQTRSLTKRYGNRTVVDGLDLELPGGVIAGFVGPNGAGKSTTLRMLLGLVRPSAGEGTVLGQPLAHPAAYLARVGALIEAPAFYPGLSATANMRVLATLGGHPTRQVPGLLERVGLSERGGDPYKTFSLGMKQRLGIAAALLGDPLLLVLDEPTNGLDPSGIREMRDLLRSVAHDGPTVFVSSHLLAEVEQVCGWLVMIEAGRQVFQGPTAELLAGGDVLVLGAERPDDLAVLADLLAGAGHSCGRSGDRLRVPLVGHRPDVAALNRAAMDRGVVLTEITISSSTLEDRYGDLVSSGGIR